jgi:hypothetical protein
MSPIQTFKVPLQNQKMGAWRAITAIQIVEHVFFNTLLIQNGMPMIFFGPFLKTLQKTKIHGYFMQNCATAQSAH